MNIVRPTLLLDERKCKANIARIVNKAKEAGVKLRPHFKTHQSHEVGRWFLDLGVRQCTVSSVKMAEYFARDGWNDITIAFPVNPLEHSLINELASKVTLNVCAGSRASLQLLSEKLRYGVKVFIEIDNGYHRTGVQPKDAETIDEMMKVIHQSEWMEFVGFLSHAGHSYKCTSVEEVIAIHDKSKDIMTELGNRYREKFPSLVLSIGDTPSCSAATDFSGVDEIRPGNLVFYDLTQAKIGVCNLDDIAIAMACPVVEINRETNEIFVHGGGVHFSKDFLSKEDGSVSYGQVVRLTRQGWSLPPLKMFVKSLSQEHGIIHATNEELATITVGDVVGILPVHACLTADAMGEYFTLDGECISMMR
jgi:D-serine deaminase-like pyridoxal phosphate-dependent protein